MEVVFFNAPVPFITNILFVDEMLGRAGQLRRCSNLQEHFDNIYNNHLVKKSFFYNTKNTIN